MVCLAETKLSEDINIKLEEKESYNMWRKERMGKKGGRVMIMIRSIIKVMKVGYSKGKVELISMQIMDIWRNKDK